MFTVILLLQNIFAIYGIVSASGDHPEIKINQGVLKGAYRQAWKGRTFSAFTGIPYAQPPLGELRFEPAVPANPWNGTLDSTKPHAICPQIIVFKNRYVPEGDEDCLYLNVYTPLKGNFENSSFPVMVYIYGGGWTCGNANRENCGPDYLLEEDVVLVALNYRIGAFGFFSTEDSVSPGNYGLKDQSLALQWVNQNIAHFGGDPKRVTIFGQSAGGASVNLHLFSPLSKGLFSGAIAQSGTLSASWAIAKPGDMLRNAKKLATLLNCPTRTNADMVKCLKNVNAYDIVNQDTQFYVFSYDPVAPYMPVIEKQNFGSFITAHPDDLIKAGEIAQVPFMTGLTSEDGAIKSAGIYNDSSAVKTLDRDFETLLPIIFRYDDDSKHITRSTRKFYFGNKKIDDSTKDELTKLMTDYCFFMPAEDMVRKLAMYSNQPVYYYLFGFRGSLSFSSIFGDPSHDYGVCHCDEFYYLLAKDFFKVLEPNNVEKQMREFMVTLWTNFAKYGNPTPNKTATVPVVWNTATCKNGDFYNIKSPTEVKMDKNLFANRKEFLDNLLHNDNFIKNEL